MERRLPATRRAPCALAGRARSSQKEGAARAYEPLSADSHVLEPPDLWTRYLRRKFRDKARRVVPDGDAARPGRGVATDCRDFVCGTSSMP